MSTCCRKFLVFCGILLLGIASDVRSQFAIPHEELNPFSEFLIVDYAYFQAEDPEMIRLELYHQIHHRGLTFEFRDNRYRASYEFTVRLENNDGETIETYSRDRDISLGASEEARTRIDFRTSQVVATVEPGDYKAYFRLKDKTTGKITVQELDLDLDKLYDHRPRLSGIEFAQAFQSQSGRRSVFDKGEAVIIPSVHRVYGSLEDDKLAYYFEVYSGSNDLESVVVETKVRHYRRGMLYRDTVHLDLSQGTQRQLREISLARFLPGEYELEIALRGRRMKRVYERKEDFRIAWSEVGMLRNDWNAVVNQLELFSEDVDVGDMKDIDGYEERLRAFNQFWLERDPTDGTPENEAKVSFYYRVRVANERFGIMRIEGWRTDRGRVYVRYGEPDYLADQPFAIDQRPYQIWTYVRITPNRQFVFIDENEDGDYRLQYPYDGLTY